MRKIYTNAVKSKISLRNRTYNVMYMVSRNAFHLAIRVFKIGVQLAQNTKPLLQKKLLLDTIYMWDLICTLRVCGNMKSSWKLIRFGPIDIFSNIFVSMCWYLQDFQASLFDYTIWKHTLERWKARYFAHSPLDARSAFLGASRPFCGGSFKLPW